MKKLSDKDLFLRDTLTWKDNTIKTLDAMFNLEKNENIRLREELRAYKWDVFLLSIAGIILALLVGVLSFKIIFN